MGPTRSRWDRADAGPSSGGRDRPAPGDPDVVGSGRPGAGDRGRRGRHAAGGTRGRERRGLRWRRRGRDPDAPPTGADLDRAAEARARAGEDAADELWLDGPPTLDEGHFEPPPPPPVPRPSRQALLAVLVIFFGVFLLAAPGVVGLDDRTGLTFGVFAILAGAALLVLRLRETRADDGPDDGAVV